MTDDPSTLDLTAQAEQIRRGDLKPLDLVNAAIARVERLDPQLNAIVSPQFERAREAAAAEDLPHGPFHGVPFLLKDLGAHLAGDPVYLGMAALKDADWHEAGETYFAGKLRAAGLISLGRTNTPELGLAPTTEPHSFGATRNPWKTSHSPGGSSGGSAAAVAAGIVPAAHASDGGGSIRIPAAHCGLVGLKPSRARNSFGPGLGERWSGFSCEGFVTRSVRDTAALIEIVCGPMPGDPYVAPPPGRPYTEEVGADPGRLRVGVMRHAPRNIALHADCLEGVTRTAQRLESLGHHLEESWPEAFEDKGTVIRYVNVVASATARALETWGAKIGRTLGEADVEPITWMLAERGRQITGPEYVATLEGVHAHGRQMAAWWDQGFDLLLSPTCAEPPPPLGHFEGTAENPAAGFAAAVPYGIFTSQINMTGQPAISLPLHWNAEGLPIGVQLVAAYGREDLLLQVASQLEQAHPWADRLPPVHASR